MRALLTGVTGQDGSYLAELLLEKGYEVYGIVRNIARVQRESGAALAGKISYVEADLTDQTSLDRAVEQVKPDEVYNLAGQTFVPVSWTQPLLTMEVTGMGALRMLKQFAGMRRRQDFSRFRVQRFSESLTRYTRANPLACGRATHTARPKCFLTISPLITVKVMACLPAPALPLTMSHPAERLSLSLAKCHDRLLALSLDWPIK